MGLYINCTDNAKIKSGTVHMGKEVQTKNWDFTCGRMFSHMYVEVKCLKNSAQSSDGKSD